MGSYVPNTKEEQLSMLREIGMESFDDLYRDIPDGMRFQGPLNLPEGRSEMEVSAAMEEMAGRNVRYAHIFRGAGSYHHYIPAIVKQVTSKEEFVTAYTPYQAEISQGLLQSIFEYQTMMCELTGMDVSNASVYDGATAAAEAVAMCRDRRRGTVCVSASVDPKVLSVIRTYCFGNGAKLIVIPQKDGKTDRAAFEELDKKDVACLYMQSPNYYGLLEDCDALCEAAHAARVKLVLGFNPIALGILKTPGEYGADVAVGEGQPLGLPMGFGGPYLGIMTATKAMMRSLPGRIVGQTTDADGKRGYVLTLQAREQHIRREKASSNICSNEALCAMTASVYLSSMGAKGLAKAATSCMSNAHYLLGALESAGFTRRYDGEFFHEFVTVCPAGTHAGELSSKLGEKGYLAGLAISDTELLWCTTEMNTKSEIDGLLTAVKEVL